MNIIKSEPKAIAKKEMSLRDKLISLILNYYRYNNQTIYQVKKTGLVLDRFSSSGRDVIIKVIQVKNPETLKEDIVFEEGNVIFKKHESDDREQKVLKSGKVKELTERELILQNVLLDALSNAYKCFWSKSKGYVIVDEEMIKIDVTISKTELEVSRDRIVGDFA